MCGRVLRPVVIDKAEGRSKGKPAEKNTNFHEFPHKWFLILSVYWVSCVQEWESWRERGHSGFRLKQQQTTQPKAKAKKILLMEVSVAGTGWDGTRLFTFGSN